MDNAKDLKLIYVLKIGYDYKENGLYEFIFSKDTTNIDIEEWGWDQSPACDNALPPTEEYIDQVISLKTKSFDLFCLHEAVDREYMHGVHTIHALAYETDIDIEDGQTQFDKLMQDSDGQPLLVFHYGMSLERIKEILQTKNVILKNEEFIETSSIVF